MIEQAIFDHLEELRNFRSRAAQEQQNRDEPSGGIISDHETDSATGDSYPSDPPRLPFRMLDSNSRSPPPSSPTRNEYSTMYS